MSRPTVTPLTYPAPHREAVRTENGWCTQPWSIAGILRTLAHGGYFSRVTTNHEFAPGAMQFAYDAQSVIQEFRS